MYAAMLRDRNTVESIEKAIAINKEIIQELQLQGEKESDIDVHVRTGLTDCEAKLVTAQRKEEETLAAKYLGAESGAPRQSSPELSEEEWRKEREKFVKYLEGRAESDD